MAKAIDGNEYDQLKAQGLANREIARRWGIPWGTFHQEKQRYAAAQQGTPKYTGPQSTAAPGCTNAK